jgi:DNA polymerase-3 subunit epsilon
MAHWSDTLAVFDTETTGLDTRHARIVTCFLGIIGPGGEVQESHSWLADPGVDIPEQASAVHGVTTEMARAEGRDAALTLSRNRGHSGGLPVFTESPLLRITRPTIFRFFTTRWFGMDISPGRSDDPSSTHSSSIARLTPIEKAREPWEWRRLTTLSPLMTRTVQMQTLLQPVVSLKQLSLPHGDTLTGDAQWLHDQQIGWSRAWAENYQKFRRNSGDAGFIASGEWPVRA